MPHRTLLGLASVLALVAAPAFAQSSAPPSSAPPSPVASEDQGKPPSERAVVPATESSAADRKSDSDKAAQKAEADKQKADADKQAQQKAEADKKADKDKAAQQKSDKDKDKNLPPPKQVGALTGNEAHGLVGRDIHNAAGDKIGTLKNLIVGADGKVAAGIIDFGGWLGSSKLVAVEWKSLQPSGDKITLNLSKDQLEAAGPFREGESSAIVSAEPMQPSTSLAGSSSTPPSTMSGSSGSDPNSSIGAR